MEKQNRRTKSVRDVPSVWEPQDQTEREIETMFRDGTIAKIVERAKIRGPMKWKNSKSVKPVKIPVTIRIDKLTLLVLKDQARDEGLRYQSLVNSVLHKYIMGNLIERKK